MVIAQAKRGSTEGRRGRAGQGRAGHYHTCVSRTSPMIRAARWRAFKGW